MAVRTHVRFKIYQYVPVLGHTILSTDHSARDLSRPSWLFDCSMRSWRVGDSMGIYLSYR